MKRNQQKQILQGKAKKMKTELTYGREAEEEEDKSNQTIYEKYRHLYTPKKNIQSLFDNGINDGIPNYILISIEDPFLIEVDPNEKGKKEKKKKFEDYETRSFW
jgi:hypothetical protein